VTVDQAVPAPELTLFCPRFRTCGYQVSVQDSLAPEVLAKGCPQCKEEELRYELCYADGRSVIPGGGSIKDNVKLKWNGDPFRKATPPGKGKIVQHSDSHSWPADDVLSGPVYTTQFAPPATITGKLNHDGTWMTGKLKL